MKNDSTLVLASEANFGALSRLSSRSDTSSITALSGMQPNSSGSGRSPRPPVAGKKPVGLTLPASTSPTGPAVGPNARDSALGLRLGITKPPLRSPCFEKSSFAMSGVSTTSANTSPLFDAALKPSRA